MSNSVAFHTRLYGQNSSKITSGSFGGPFDIDTANRLINNHDYTVTIKPSGTPVFVDKEGREVTLYFQINPSMTDKGKAAIAADRKEREALERIEQRKRDTVESLLDGMSMDEALRRLTS